MLKDEEEDDETYYSMMQRYTAAKLHTNTFQKSVAGLNLWGVFVCVCLSGPRGNVVPLSHSLFR